MINQKSEHGHCFTKTYNGIVRSLPTIVSVESSTNTGKLIEANALWDTGASSSLIRPEIAAKLDLKPISKTLMATPSDQEVPSNIYLINIYLPSKARIVKIQALEGIPNNCDMLIGMDVIAIGDFAVTNFNGQTKFSFRIPSMTEIDFCK